MSGKETDDSKLENTTSQQIDNDGCTNGAPRQQTNTLHNAMLPSHSSRTGAAGFDSTNSTKRTSRRGGPDLDPDEMISPMQKQQRKTGQGPDDGIPELFPVTSARTPVAWGENETSRYEKEQEKVNAYNDSEKKTSARPPSGVATPEVFPDTVATTTARMSSTAPSAITHDIEKDGSLQKLRASRGVIKEQSELDKAGLEQSRRSTRGHLRESLGAPAALDSPAVDMSMDEQGMAGVHSSQTQNAAAAEAASAPQVVPGAVAVRGIDATEGGDDDHDDGFIIGDERTVASSPSRRRLPEAQSVRDEEDELFEGLEAAELVPEGEIKEEKEPGLRGWIKRRKRLVAILLLIIIGAVVGGVVGAMTGGGGGGSPDVPTSAPTVSPTSAPTLDDFELVAPTLSTITPVPVLTDPTTPQNAAVTWLLREDGFNLDFGNAPKLLQRYTLATIYFATNGPNWTNQLNFLSDQDECLWNEDIGQDTFGVLTCNDQGMLVDLQLSQNGLQGTFPNEVVAFEAMVSISASISQLFGTIPETLFSLTNIDDIRMFDNNLVGSVPNSLGNLAKLTHLAIQRNALTGTIPASIGEATDLAVLALTENLFSGPLPSTLGNLVSLTDFFLATNQLSGTVPTEMSAMTSLLNIRLEENNLVGSFEPFCTGSIDFNALAADCFEVNAPGLPNVEPEVDCPCCTICCADNTGCLRNTPL